MPQVEYTTTSDGVRIAYAATGRGQPLLCMPPLPFRHIALEWESPEDRQLLEWIASHFQLIQYDPRGLGLSERNPPNYSQDGLIDDVESVVRALDLERVAIFGSVNCGPLAMEYAARYPERVSHLILWCAAPQANAGVGDRLDAIRALIEQDWELATQTLAHMLRGWSASQSAATMAEMLRACATPESMRGLWEDAGSIDVSDRLSQIAAPTLVLHRREVSWISLDCATELASSIPNARLVLLEGDSMAPWAGDLSAVTRAIADFMGITGLEPATPENAFRREGEYWTLSFESDLCRLREAKGLHHIAYLLKRPGEPVTATELLWDLEPPSEGHAPPVSGDAGPVLDAQARRTYGERIEELREELADAGRSGDVAREEAARVELEAIEDQLAGAVGLGGRDRRAASDAERARVTVTKRIRDSLARIRKEHAALGEHLEQGLRTGRVCAYRPAEPVPWSF